MKGTDLDEPSALTDRSGIVIGEPGTDAIELLAGIANEHPLDRVGFSAIGGFQQATIGWFDRDRQDYNRIEIDELCEVLSLTGDITPGPAGPQVRAHVVLGLSDGTTRGGQLLAATIWPSIEVSVSKTRAAAAATDPARTNSRLAVILCGVALILLGAWGALSPFFGPSFDFGFAPDQTWLWTSARGWLEVLPGCVAALAGLVMIISPNRVVVVLGGLLATIAGGWFIVGTSLADLLHIGSIGTPLGARPGIASLESVALFYGLGGVILLLVAFVLGRLSARSFGRAGAGPAIAPAAEPVAVVAIESRDRWEGSPAPAH